MANRIQLASGDVNNFLFHELVETCCVIDGEGFRFNVPANPETGFAEQRRDYLIPIYNLFRPENLLFFARQCEKSTTLSARMLCTCQVYPHYKWLYLNASLNQVSDFSKDKLDTMIIDSPVFNRTLYNPRSHNVHDKYFRNGSFIKLRGMFNGPGRARGISADGICVDETQDILIDDMYVALEVQSHSVHPMRQRLYAGTPKSTANTMEKLKMKANHHELVFKCEHCNKQQIILIDNIGPKGLICSNKKCQKPLNPYGYKWMCVQQMPSSRMSSFRLPQPVIPTAHTSPDKWSEIIDKLNRYPAHVFDNEVLAISSGDAERPVTEAMIRAICNETRDMMEPKHYSGTFLGVDYGRGTKSFTQAVVIQIANGKPTLIFAKKFIGSQADPLVYIPELKKIFFQYGCIAMGVDSGDGFMQNSTLKHEVGHDKVWVFCSTGNLKDELRWDTDSAQFSFSRTKQLTKRFAEIKMKYVVWPKYHVMQQYAQDFYNVFSEERPETRSFIYNHEEDEPDDFVHAWNNALMTAEVAGAWQSPVLMDANMLKR